MMNLAKPAKFLVSFIMNLTSPILATICNQEA